MLKLRNYILPIPYLCIVWQLLVFFVYAPSLLAGPVMDRLTVDQGLSQNQVTSILHDENGYVWIGTQDGLNRYDGYTFKKIKSEPFNHNSLSNEIVMGLARQGRQLWVATGKGMCVIRPNLEVRRFKPAENDRILQVKSLQDKIYFSTDSTIWELSHGPAGNQMRKIWQGKGGKVIATNQKYVLIGIHNKLWQYNSAGHRLKLIHSFSENIRQLATQAADEVYVLAGKQVFKLHIGAQSVGLVAINSKPDAYITRIFADNKQQLWLGTADHGVFALDAKGKQFLHVPTADAVLSMAQQPGLQSDIIWIGTLSSGLIKYSFSKNSFQNFNEVLQAKLGSKPAVFAIHHYRGKLLAASPGGLVQIDHNTETAQKIMGPDKYQINGLAVLNNKLLAATNGGLWFSTGEGFHWQKLPLPQLINPFIFCLQKQADTVYVGTVGKVYKIWETKGNLATESIKIPGTLPEIQNIGHIIFDKQRQMYLASTNGLYIRKSDLSWAHINHLPNNKNSLIDNQVNGLVLDQRRDLWVCTGKGISKVRLGKTGNQFTHITEAQGLASGFVYGGLADSQGALWFSTNRGIVRILPSTLQMRHFSSADGLGLTEFNSGAFYQRGDTLYFGGAGGMVRFNSMAIAQNNNKPTVLMQNLWVNGKKIDVKHLTDKALTLPEGSYLQLELAASDYTNPEQNSFEFQLKPEHNQMQALGHERMVSLSQLPNGPVELWAKAANNQGLWGAERQLLQLYVRPVLYKRPWFIMALAGMVAALIWLWYRFRLAQQRALALAVQQENDRVRQLAAQDIHDEFGNSLTRISLLAELVRSRSEAHNVELQHLAGKIYDNAQRLYQGTKDFVWSINLENNSVQELATRLKDYVDEVLDHSHIQFVCLGLDDTLADWQLNPGQNRQVLMIFKEAISNSIKHAQKADRMELSFSLEGDILQIVWQDNGQNSNLSQTNGFGLHNMRQRAEKIQAALAIQAEASGVKVALSVGILPKNNNF